jgi:LPXTG-site transpeptidase (sortase) family protein
MKFVDTWRRRKEKKYQILYKKGPSTLALIFAGMALALWGMFVLLSSYPVGLYLYYSVLPKTTDLLGKALQETSSAITAQARTTPVVTTPEENSVPTKDISLPEGHYLNIPRIGVDTIIWEGEGSNYEKALKKGVWRVGDFATPEEKGQGKPIILAAHRFGYLEWSQDYRLKNSFYDLPKLKNGDVIEIVWDQVRYTYQIQRVEEGTEITDYSSDLILYTCKFLVSPVRIFVYAKLIP